MSEGLAASADVPISSAGATDGAGASAARERSRSPRRDTSKGGAELVEKDVGWASRFRKALGSTLGWNGKAESDSQGSGAQANATDDVVDKVENNVSGNVVDSADKPPTEPVQAMNVEAGTEGIKETSEVAAADEEMPIPTPWLPFACVGCSRSFASSAERKEHLLGSVNCTFLPWQTVVHVMACLPGAGTTLWCPACPVNCRWQGSANKASAFLRHADAASTAGTPHDAQHHRLFSTLVELLLANPPPADADTLALQEWAGGSRLLGAAGPLLAKPNPSAYKALRKLETEMLGPDTSGIASVAPATWELEPGQREEDTDNENEAATEDTAAGSEAQAQRILGLDLTVEGSGLYDEDVPLEGGCEGIPPTDDADAPSACLPAGGAAALTSFDLTLSSSDDEAPASADAAATSSAGAAGETFI